MSLVEWDDQKWPDLPPAKPLLGEAVLGFKSRLTEQNQGACVWPGSVEFLQDPWDSRGDHIRLAPDPLPEPDPWNDCYNETYSELESLDSQSSDSSIEEEANDDPNINRITWDQFLRFVPESPTSKNHNDNQSASASVSVSTWDYEEVEVMEKETEEESSYAQESEEEVKLSVPSTTNRLKPRKPVAVPNVLVEQSYSSHHAKVKPNQVDKKTKGNRNGYDGDNESIDTNTGPSLEEDAQPSAAQRAQQLNQRIRDQNAQSSVAPRTQQLNKRTVTQLKQRLSDTEKSIIEIDCSSSDSDESILEVYTCSDSAKKPQARNPPNKNNGIWDERYEQLKAYVAKYGDCLVPSSNMEFPKLGQWVASQRRQRKQQTMSKERERKLQLLGFEWDGKTCRDHENDMIWMQKYEELLLYKQKNGHCRVPFNYDANPSLGRWVHYQRTAQRKGNLAENRHSQLELIDFDWEPGQRRGARSKRYVMEF